MSERWVRCILTAKFLADAHLGSGSGGQGIDALVARDRYRRPVIWASHVEGVLRDAARRLGGDQYAEGFFGRKGGDYARGDRQRAVFTSLYSKDELETRVWRSTAREAFDNRAPKEETLRAIEHVPKGATFTGEVELPEREAPVLERLVQEVDALGSGRATGAGRVKLSLAEVTATPRAVGGPRERLLLLLKNRDPLCIAATASPDNLIPSLPFVRGRTLLGALAAWLIADGDRLTASLLTSGRVSVSDALPLPQAPANLEGVEVLPAPLSLQSEKPRGSAGSAPWWALPEEAPRRLDLWSLEAEAGRRGGAKFKRPEKDLFVYRAGPTKPWLTYCPARRVRLRNGRPAPDQREPSLFAIEQIVEETYFLAELRGSLADMERLAATLGPVLDGRRWLRIGRAGAPVEVAQLAWGSSAPPIANAEGKALLILTSDLLVRDELLRWRTGLDELALKEIVGVDDLKVGMTDEGTPKIVQDHVMIHGFNGTSRVWRMPAAAIRRGSVFEISGAVVAELARGATAGHWLGERTHEGFGRFRIDTALPGVTQDIREPATFVAESDSEEEAIAARTYEWLKKHGSLARPGKDRDRKPSLSQWFELVAALGRDDRSAIAVRLNPTTSGTRTWKHKDSVAILQKLESLSDWKRRAAYARFFVRWLRAEMRKEAA